MVSQRAKERLARENIKTTADLDRWIAAHPYETKEGRVRHSRFGALKVLVGENDATWILHDLATSALPLPSGGRWR